MLMLVSVVDGVGGTSSPPPPVLVNTASMVWADLTSVNVYSDPVVCVLTPSITRWDSLYALFGENVNFTSSPSATFTCPDGEMLPPVPADAVIT